MLGLSQADDGSTVLSEVWSHQSEGGASYSVEVRGFWASKLVRHHQLVMDSRLNHRPLPKRKEILDSRSHKRLRALNIILDTQAAVLDDERVALAKVLQDCSAGMVLEQALHELCTELTVLEAQDVALRQQVAQETRKLSQLEQKVGQTLDYCLELLILSDADCAYLCWRWVFGGVMSVKTRRPIRL